MNTTTRAGSKLWYARVEQLAHQWHSRHDQSRMPSDVIRDHMQMAANERAWTRGQETTDLY